MFSNGPFSDHGFSDSGQTSSNGEIISVTLYIQKGLSFIVSILTKFTKILTIKTKHEADI